jgi:heme-degrading monooxygenase HmoA
MSDPVHDPWFAPDRAPPYVALLVSARLGGDAPARAAYAAEVYRLAARSPGFIGAERSGEHQGHIISAIFWENRAALDAWLVALEAVQPAPDPRIEVARVYDHLVLRIVTVEAVVSRRCPPDRLAE